MKISTESVIHYTPKFENIFSIIKSGFKFSLLTEELPFTHNKESFFAKFDGLRVIIFQQQVSAVCFCDLPFDLVGEHRDQYGKYCIALSKDWAIKSGITPVRYIHHSSPDIHSEIYKIITQQINLFKKFKFNIFKVYSQFLRDTEQVKNLKDEDLENLPEDIKKLLKIVNQQYNDIMDYTLIAMGYLRNYHGNWKDKITNEVKERKFYNEREWRALQLNRNEYLKFDIKDVTQILVETKEEKDTLTKELREKLKISNVDLAKINVFNEITEDLKNSL